MRRFAKSWRSSTSLGEKRVSANLPRAALAGAALIERHEQCLLPIREIEEQRVV